MPSKLHARMLLAHPTLAVTLQKYHPMLLLACCVTGIPTCMHSAPSACFQAESWRSHPVLMGSGLPAAMTGIGAEGFQNGFYGGEEAAGQLLAAPVTPDQPASNPTLYITGLPADITKRELAHVFRPFLGFLVSLRCICICCHT